MFEDPSMMNFTPHSLEEQKGLRTARDEATKELDHQVINGRNSSN